MFLFSVGEGEPLVTHPPGAVELDFVAVAADAAAAHLEARQLAL